MARSGPGTQDAASAPPPMNATLTVKRTRTPQARLSRADRPAVDAQALRAMMGHFPTGVTIVGSHFGGRDEGMTANSLTCVSLDPPLVAVCAARGSRTDQAIESSGGFAVTFLAHHQKELARKFARVAADHFHGVATGRTSLGHPHLPEGIGFMECVVRDAIEAGDHTVFIAHVTESALAGGEPLVFFRSRLGSLPESRDASR
jgi:3-hydroxy-9,10-secoandrosta-1,3,5(10)-triene-9,17-dione monooxygenase reductase component